jgi:hypothetical protein
MDDDALIVIRMPLIRKDVKTKTAVHAAGY